MKHKRKYTRAFGNCERCTNMRCVIWFCDQHLLCTTCRDAYDAQQDADVERRSNERNYG